jgi:hypothetical protein
MTCYNAAVKDPEDVNPTPNWQDVFATLGRILTFRASRQELLGLGYKHLAVGLAFTWIVGIGRYWDNPRVGVLQHLGVGSVIYVFILSLFLYLLISPLGPKNWTYRTVLIFVSLVSPPALLYAVPVERFLTLDAANSVNAWFLAIVAAWRLALLVFFLRRLGKLDVLSTVIATLLPMTLIIVTLSILNLEKVVFDFMGGIRNRTSSDAAYGVLFFLSLISVLLFIPLLVTYLVLMLRNLLGHKTETAE